MYYFFLKHVSLLFTKGYQDATIKSFHDEDEIKVSWIYGWHSFVKKISTNEIIFVDRRALKNDNPTPTRFKCLMLFIINISQSFLVQSFYFTKRLIYLANDWKFLLKFYITIIHACFQEKVAYNYKNKMLVILFYNLNLF